MTTCFSPIISCLLLAFVYIWFAKSKTSGRGHMLTIWLTVKSLTAYVAKCNETVFYACGMEIC